MSLCDQQNISKSEKTESKMWVLFFVTSCVDRPLLIINVLELGDKTDTTLGEIEGIHVHIL